MRRCAIIRFGQQVVAKYEDLLATSSDPVSAIRAEFKSAAGKDIVTYAGSVEGAEKLSLMLVRVCADARAFDELRYHFAVSFASLPKFPNEFCSLYLQSLRTSETCSLDEIASTLEIMRAKGGDLSELSCRTAVAELLMRSGGEVEPIIDDLVEAASDEEARGKLLEFVDTAYKTRGWSPALLKLAESLLRHDRTAHISEPMQFSLLRDQSLSARLTALMLALLRKRDALCIPDVEVCTFIRSRPLTRDAQVALSDAFCANPSVREALALELMNAGEFRASVDIGVPAGISAAAIVAALSPLSIAKIDALYEALEGLKNRGGRVPRAALEGITQACIALGDTERAAQTRASYTFFESSQGGAEM